MSKTFPLFCRDCIYSKPDHNSGHTLQCHNPIVNSKNNWALANKTSNGATCTTEREGGFFSACGQRGRLWEPKPPTNEVKK